MRFTEEDGGTGAATGPPKKAKEVGSLSSSSVASASAVTAAATMSAGATAAGSASGCGGTMLGVGCRDLRLAGASEEALVKAMQGILGTRTAGREHPFGAGRWGVFNAATGQLVIASVEAIEAERNVHYQAAVDRWRQGEQGAATAVRQGVHVDADGTGAHGAAAAVRQEMHVDLVGRSGEVAGAAGAAGGAAAAQLATGPAQQYDAGDMQFQTRDQLLRHLARERVRAGSQGSPRRRARDGGHSADHGDLHQLPQELRPPRKRLRPAPHADEASVGAVAGHGRGGGSSQGAEPTAAAARVSPASGGRLGREAALRATRAREGEGDRAAHGGVARRPPGHSPRPPERRG